MATLTVQELPRYGVGLGGITFGAATGVGDDFPNDGRTILLVKGVTGWTTETVQVEGVPSQDSARDGTATLNPGGIGDLDVAGPFNPRNWNLSGSVQLTYPSGVTGLEVAVVRITTG